MEVWIGLAEVRATPDELLKGGKGAVVSVLAWADSVEDYAAKAAECLEQSDTLLIEFTDVEKFELRQKNFEVADYIKQLADEVAETKRAAFGTFHIYMADDA